MKTSNHPLDFSGVEETAFLTLYAKAIESQSQKPIIKDEKAEQLVNQLDIVLQDRHSRMADQLLNRKIEQRLITHIALRAKKYDDIAINYLKGNPFGPLVNIACGLDTRFFRLDNGKVNFYDLDLPEMIHLKQQLVEESSQYQMIGQSVLDFSWMDVINNDGKPALFLMEGILMYLPEEDVKSLVLEILKRFPGSELACELTNRL